MAKTKQVNIESQEEEHEEPKEEKKRTPVPRRKQPVKLDEANIALLKDMLARIASREIDDLKQLTDLPLKLVDVIAKAAAYYEATLRTLEEQYSCLLDWYIEMNEDELANLQAIIDEPVPEPPKPKKTIWTMIFGQPKIKEDPKLVKFELDEKRKELEERIAFLKAEKEGISEIDISGSYFMQWLYNLCLNRRSLGGHLLENLSLLADAQILNQQQNNFDKSSIFTR